MQGVGNPREEFFPNSRDVRLSEGLRAYFERIESAYEREEELRMCLAEVDRLRSEHRHKSELHAYWIGKKDRMGRLFVTGDYIDDRGVIVKQHRFTPQEKFQSDFCQLLENLAQQMDYYRKDYMITGDDTDSEDDSTPLRLIPDPVVGAVEQSCGEWLAYLRRESFFLDDRHRAAHDCLVERVERSLHYFARRSDPAANTITLEMYLEGAEFQIERLAWQLPVLAERIASKARDADGVKDLLQTVGLGVTLTEIDQHFELASAQKQAELGLPSQDFTFGGLLILRNVKANLAESPPRSPRVPEACGVGVKRSRENSGGKREPTEEELQASIFGDQARYRALQSRIPLYVLAWQKHMCILYKASALPGIDMADSQRFMLEYARLVGAGRAFRNSHAAALRIQHLNMLTKSGPVSQWDVTSHTCPRHARYTKDCVSCSLANCASPTKFQQLLLVLMELQSPPQADAWLTLECKDLNMVAHLVHGSLTKEELAENWKELEAADDVASCVTRTMHKYQTLRAEMDAYDALVQANHSGPDYAVVVKRGRGRPRTAKVPGFQVGDIAGQRASAAALAALAAAFVPAPAGDAAAEGEGDALSAAEGDGAALSAAEGEGDACATAEDYVDPSGFFIAN